MTDAVIHEKTTGTYSSPRTIKSRHRFWLASTVMAALIGGGLLLGPRIFEHSNEAAAAPAMPTVSVSAPIQGNVESRLQLLGQFSAVQSVELRAQVGGILTKIGFKDGEIVHQGDVLFEIDPTPYEIKLSEAKAQLETAKAKLELASRQFERADTLKKNGFGTIENADQRSADQRAAQAAVQNAEAAIRDAQFDLDHARITAPFTGRIGTHMVSVGNLVAGSRAGTSPTTLLATIVSVDSIWLNFDMSEADYMAFQRERQAKKSPLADKVDVSLSDEADFSRQGTLDFIDNAMDRSSGTIHARATLQNGDQLLTPGGFARVRVALSAPAPALLVPDAAVLPDQSEHMVLTVGADNVVTSKKVQLGDLRNGLRVIRSGLTATDKVIISGIPVARPGAKVNTEAGSIKFASK
jgi:RND family efflux transporter MFP subunit